MITFVTGNKDKADFAERFFGVSIKHRKLDLPEIQSLDLATIVKDKAKRAYAIVQEPVLVEDVSLIFNALGRLPGPLIKWFIESIGNDGLCHLLDQYVDRSAHAEIAFALCDKSGVRLFSGSVNGMITNSPCGELGFGWDPIFIPKGATKTLGEMGKDEHHAISMRKSAYEALRSYIVQILSLCSLLLSIQFMVGTDIYEN